jgi:hypothetical protein
VTTPTVALVACTKRKIDHAAPARDLYCSTWFKLARTWAEQHANAWYILSAKHGLVQPDQVLEPYDAALKNQWQSNEFAVLVRTALLEQLPAGTTVVFLAGKYYWLYLGLNLQKAGHTVETPLHHLGIGEQMAWLKRESIERKEG